MQMSQQINELVKAVSAFQGEVRPALKDGNNPFFKSSYSSFTSVWEAIRSPLSKNGLAVFQDARTIGDQVSVTTVLAHSSGQWMSFGPIEVAVKKEAHAVGSGISYCKRYALSAALGVVSEEDDDGNKATESGKTVAPVSRIGAESAKKLLALVPVEDLENVKQTIYRMFNINKVEDIPLKDYMKVYNGLTKKYHEKTEVQIDGDDVELDPKEHS